MSAKYEDSDAKTSRNVKTEELWHHQGNNNFLVTKSQIMKIYNLPDKELKVGTLIWLSEIQENTKRQFNAIRKTIHEQHEMFNKDVEIIRKHQIDSGAKEYNEWNENYDRRHWQYKGLAKETVKY